MKILIIIFSLTVFSCVHSIKNENKVFTDTESLLQDPRLQDLSINVRCSVLDMKGNSLKRFNGLYCRFQNDGSYFVAGGAKLLKMDKNLTKVWEFPLAMNHHQLVYSPVTGNLLTLDSLEYTENGQPFRGDVLAVVDSNGKLIKRLDFREILKQVEKLGISLKPASEATWISRFTNPHSSIFEQTHLNSFYETWDSSGKTVTGYVVNDYHQQKIYFLDPKKFKLVSVVDMDGKAIHDVQVYKNKLYFYVNSDQTAEIKWHSYIGSYDLNTKTFEVRYKSEEDAYSANACSSLQVIDDNFFAILHSACAPTPETTHVPKFAIVDTAKKLRYRLTLEKNFPATNAYLFNSKEFLKNNGGF